MKKELQKAENDLIHLNRKLSIAQEQLERDGKEMNRQTLQLADLESALIRATAARTAAEDIGREYIASFVNKDKTIRYYQAELSKAHTLIGRLLHQLSEMREVANLSPEFPTHNPQHRRAPGDLF